jgi:hypothetical protein
MSKALNATGRPILFSLCEWGLYDVWEWGMQRIGGREETREEKAQEKRQERRTNRKGSRKRIIH